MNSFEYLVTLVSIIAGLGLTRALSGIAKVVQAGGDRKLSGVHMAWTASVLLWLVTFWWFTFLLASIDTWTVPLLLFILLYGAVIYFLIALLYPDKLEAETDFLAYFLENRRWFFGTFVALGVLDLADTWLKDRLLGPVGPPLPMVPYSLLMISWISLGVVGVVSASRVFHRVFAYSWVVVIGLYITISLFELGTTAPIVE
jgi:hypothetical protein